MPRAVPSPAPKKGIPVLKEAIDLKTLNSGQEIYRHIFKVAVVEITPRFNKGFNLQNNRSYRRVIHIIIKFRKPDKEKPNQRSHSLHTFSQIIDIRSTKRSMRAKTSEYTGDPGI
jgi:hypothetical protein